MGLWQASTVMVAGMVWFIAQPEAAAPASPPLSLHQEELLGASSEHAAQPSTEVALLQHAVARLQEDNATMRDNVSQLRHQHHTLSQDYLKLTLRSALDSAVGVRPRFPEGGVGRLAALAPALREGNVATRGPLGAPRSGGVEQLRAGLDAFDHSGLYGLADRMLSAREAAGGSNSSVSNASFPRGSGGVGGGGGLEGLVQLRELEPLLELLLALRSQDGGLSGMGGGGGLGAIQEIAGGFGADLTERERRLWPALVLVALARASEEDAPSVE